MKTLSIAGSMPNPMPVRCAGQGSGLSPAEATERRGPDPPEGKPRNSEVLKEAARLLRSGAILALKGLGGFHLACDATDSRSVKTLRERKQRPHKPLAVMLPNLEEIRNTVSSLRKKKDC